MVQWVGLGCLWSQGPASSAAPAQSVTCSPRDSAEQRISRARAPPHPLVPRVFPPSALLSVVLSTDSPWTPLLNATAPRRVAPPAQADQAHAEPRTPAAPSDAGGTEMETR